MQHLVPIPAGESLLAINQKLIAILDARTADTRNAEGRTIAELFDEERGRMLPLHSWPFDTRETRVAVASPRSLVKVDGAHYSVPSTWHRLDVTVHIGPADIEIVGPSGTAKHTRQRFGGRSIDYRHYLTELAKKPQAVRQVAAELMRDLGEPYGRIWRVLVDESGPKQAARIFARVLSHVVERGSEDVGRTLIRALETETPLLLALAPPAQEEPRLQELPASLREIDVPSGSARDYDVWLLGGAR